MIELFFYPIHFLNPCCRVSSILKLNILSDWPSDKGGVRVLEFNLIFSVIVRSGTILESPPYENFSTLRSIHGKP